MDGECFYTYMFPDSPGNFRINILLIQLEKNMKNTCKIFLNKPDIEGIYLMHNVRESDTGAVSVT
jgi:hypothetical protein